MQLACVELIIAVYDDFIVIAFECVFTAVKQVNKLKPTHFIEISSFHTVELFSFSFFVLPMVSIIVKWIVMKTNKKKWQNYTIIKLFGI